MHSNFNDLKTKTMEDINNALLYIKAKHNGEIPYKYGSQECAKLMNSYAEQYHQAKLKLLGIADVVGRGEQLQSFVSGFYQWHKKQNYVSVKREDWDEYIKTL